MPPTTIHWFRRDLRLDDNTALNAAIDEGNPVLCLFIFDTEILDKLPEDDARVTFIHEELGKIDRVLKKKGSSVCVRRGKPVDVWKQLIRDYDIASVHTNRDYEPYARDRDHDIARMLKNHDIPFTTHKDQVVFGPGEVLKDDGDPYTVYTPYKKKWLERFENEGLPDVRQLKHGAFYKIDLSFPDLKDIGFKKSHIKVPAPSLEHIEDYDKRRDDPAGDFTTHLGPHLRFGTVSIREMAILGCKRNKTFLSELVWREFFMQILYHYPHVVSENFNKKYDALEWRNKEAEFVKWCKGLTGFPMVDAGMRQLNETGYMHNRVRMVVASFLTKHLLIDWRWGEAYFAEKLLDYELASNNGNWQWAAGTGCDAAPYFRIFNPHTQLNKFDPYEKYVQKWLPELGTPDYPEPMVEHKAARERALETYKNALN